MKILAACEESQVVTIELRRLGHEAYSCDIIPCSGGHPEWHIMHDVLPLLNGNCEFETADGTLHKINGKWDMIIAFPPCTKTSNAGARHLWKGGKLNIPRYYEGLCGKALFLAVWAADCERVAIENPRPSKIFEYPAPMQVIQPYEYGDPFTKAAIDPQDAGRWEQSDDGDGIICPECRADWGIMSNETERFRYCPNCGSDMI